MCESPSLPAMERIDQCVRRPASSVACAQSRRRPDRHRSCVACLARASSSRPSMRSFKNAPTPLALTVCSWTPSSRATTLLGKPSAHRRMIRHVQTKTAPRDGDEPVVRDSPAHLNSAPTGHRAPGRIGQNLRSPLSRESPHLTMNRTSGRNERRKESRDRHAQYMSALDRRRRC